MNEENPTTPMSEDPQNVNGQQWAQQGQTSAQQNTGRNAQNQAPKAGPQGQQSHASQAGAQGHQPHASQAGPQGAPPNQTSESMQQMMDGAKQLATEMSGSMKDYYSSNIAPAANEAMASAQATVRESRQDTPKERLTTFGPLILAGSVALGIIALFFPVTHLLGASYNFLHDYAGNMGSVMMFLFFVTLILAVMTFVKKTTGLVIATGVI